MPGETISVQELTRIFQSGGNVELIDVRTPVEFREVHVTGARNVPLETIDPHSVMQSRNGNASEPLYVICHSGERAAQACQKFLDAGFDNVINIEGGTLAWDEAGQAVTRGKKAISLERQVRITAGVLVVLGVVLGYLVHPYFAGLSAFVGAGLVYAGVTNSCPMGMTLAKMPWNQVSKQGTSCCSR